MFPDLLLHVLRALRLLDLLALRIHEMRAGRHRGIDERVVEELGGILGGAAEDLGEGGEGAGGVPREAAPDVGRDEGGVGVLE